MHDIKASVILAKEIEDDNIKNIIKTLPNGQKNVIWMYLTLKTNLNDEEEIHIGFDIIKVDDKSNFGIELGEFVVGKTNDKEKRDRLLSNRNHVLPKTFETEESKSIFSYQDIYTIGLKFPPLPLLEEGAYEFIVYEKDGDENHILDTFQFDVE